MEEAKEHFKEEAKEEREEETKAGVYVAPDVMEADDTDDDEKEIIPVR